MKAENSIRLMKKIKNILFVQLPLLDHSMGYVQGNVPYAGATLAGYIRQRIGANYEIEQLPYMIANFASDMVILNYIENRQPDVIGFTTYLWNLERNLALAAAVKRSDASITVIFGGPEIAIGSAAFHEHHPYVDYFFCGEGEWFFSYFLNDEYKLKDFTSLINENTLVTQPASELTPPNAIIEPFTSGFLEPMPDNSIFLEMTRGCPYRCSYCYYSKNCFSVRELPFANLLSALDAYERVSEIYILSPTFDRSKDFTQKLKKLRAKNFGISLHTEMRADRIDAKTAKLLKEAGFNSMELGLQTLNDEVLKTVRRSSNPEAELNGMIHMKNADIDLKIGIIPGLPHETSESFNKTIERLARLGFAPNIELYPLMILPGTTIRDEADKEKVSYQNKPPYFYTGGWGMDFHEIQAFTKNLELETGFGQRIISLPHFSFDTENTGSPSLIKAVFFNGEDPAAWKNKRYHRYIETACFDFHITFNNTAVLTQGMIELFTTLPSENMYTFIFYGEPFFDEAKLISIADDFTTDTISARMAFFNSFKDSCPFRFFQLFKNIDNYSKAWNRYNFIDPILQMQSETAGHVLSFLRENDPNEHFLVAGKNLPNIVLEEIFTLYKDCPDMISFADGCAQKGFNEQNDLEYTETGFEFRCVRC